LRDDELYVALAGSHQIALIDLREGTIEPIAGNGREALIDGPGEEAALAQPSGLSLQNDVLYVADSESSGVRGIDLRKRRVYTLAGGPGLFDFGDRLGKIEAGMLQHPLAVAATANGVIVADTYNDKLKRFSPDGLRLDAFFEGAADSKLAQPAGLAVTPSGEVLVADTNHHRIVKVSADGARAYELTIRGAPVPRHGVALDSEPSPATQPGSGAGWFTAILPAPRDVGLSPGPGKLILSVTAPEGMELAAGGPWSASLEISRRSDLLKIAPEFTRGETSGGRAEAQHPYDVDSELLVELRAVACDAVDHAACYPVKNSFRVPLRLLRDAGQREVRVTLPLEVRR
jgi:hypothetical protein